MFEGPFIGGDKGKDIVTTNHGTKAKKVHKKILAYRN